MAGSSRNDAGRRLPRVWAAPMTIDRFTPRLFAGIVGVALAGALVAIGYVLWAGIQMSIHGYVAIFLGAFLTAALGLLLGVTMHIGQLRQEAEEARRRPPPPPED
jgi:hypothetical protein